MSSQREEIEWMLESSRISFDYAYGEWQAAHYDPYGGYSWEDELARWKSLRAVAIELDLYERILKLHDENDPNDDA